MSPWGDKNAENNDGTPKTYSIYVCGAVEKEGYYEVNEGETYFAAISQAGLLLQSSLPSISSSIVDGALSFVIVQYKENDIVCDCVNVNHQFILLRYPIDGIPDEIVNKIADYLEANGAIHNKKVLREVLGEQDYENYHYKLYIAEADYEKAD